MFGYLRKKEIAVSLLLSPRKQERCVLGICQGKISTTDASAITSMIDISYNAPIKQYNTKPFQML